MKRRNWTVTACLILSVVNLVMVASLWWNRPTTEVDELANYCKVLNTRIDMLVGQVAVMRQDPTAAQIADTSPAAP